MKRIVMRPEKGDNRKITVSSERRGIEMAFLWTTITVKNMEESLKFYQEIVGLPLGRRFGAGPGMEIAFLGDGETKVELISNDKIDSVNLGTDISLGFAVKSVEEKITFLEGKGIGIHSGPFSPNPHVKYFFILDPNGLKIQFVENA
jgi:lactoylglutathione lyase